MSQRLFKKLIPLLGFFFLLSGYSVGGGVQVGGEIPWPLSTQRVISVQHSKGLWELESLQKTKLFNVEMYHDSRSGYDWVRVSQIDPSSFEVIAWGEAFFSGRPSYLNSGLAKSWESSFEPGLQVDKQGRYLYLYPNGDLRGDPYLLRMVEVQTSIGRVLGLSMINYVENRRDHFLGTRVLEDPMVCFENQLGSFSLSCDLP